MDARKNLFVTGRPGVGKTTLIRRVLSDLGVDAGGFTTHEIREAGKRVGFAVTDLRGPAGVLAHVDFQSEHRVGKYGVNRADLERVGVAALESAVAGAALIVMDEIGRMELCSPGFQKAVLQALDSPKPVLGTIQESGNPFLDGVRARVDVEVLRVTEGNRSSLAPLVLLRVRELLADRR
jgi:nucleoside-triphosphatase